MNPLRCFAYHSLSVRATAACLRVHAEVVNGAAKDPHGLAIADEAVVGDDKRGIRSRLRRKNLTIEVRHHFSKRIPHQCTPIGGFAAKFFEFN